jgi:hypothetical protein
MIFLKSVFPRTAKDPELQHFIDVKRHTSMKSVHETAFQFRSGNHALGALTKDTVPMAGDEIVNCIADERRNDIEDSNEGKTFQSCRNSDHGVAALINPVSFQ